MKNKFEVRGDVTVIFLHYKGEITTTLISTEDLPKVSSIPGRWYAMDVGGKRGEKIYVGTKIGGVTVYLHQIIAMNPPKTVVDHYNHNTLDNRRDNLRVASYAANGQNRQGAQRNNVHSGLRNVYRNQSGNWFVRLVKDGKPIHVGTFRSIEEANRAAVKARQKYYGLSA
jgi:hypothetical protein